MQVRPRDMARIGQLALQGGLWRGDQVVPRSWIETSIRDALCLQDRLELTTPDGPLLAHPAPASQESGSFWAFDPANAEVAVKILDGRTINDHFWIYSGSLTDLPHRLVVDDRETGETHVLEVDGGLPCGVAVTDLL